MAAAVSASRNLTPGRLFVFSLAALPVGAFVATLTVYLPNYYAAHIGISLGAVGVVFMTVRLLDIIFDPALGMLIDATRSPIGKFRPWLLASAPVLMAATYATYLAPVGVGPVYLTGWLLVLYAGYSMLVLSQASWGAALVAEYHMRSRVYGWIQVAGVIGALGILFVPLEWTKYVPGTILKGVPGMGYFVLFAIPFTALVTVLFAPEPEVVEHKSAERFTARDYLRLISRPAMRRILLTDLLCTLGPAITAPLYLFFFEQARGYTPPETTILLIIYIFAGVPAPAFWARVAKRLGKHQTIRIGSIAYVIAQTCLLLVPNAHLGMMSIAMFTVGFTASAFSFLIRAMVADVSDEVRLETGKDRTGLLYALESMTAKFGSTVSVGVAYTILPLFGFVAKEGAVNTSAAMWGLQACYLVPPVACVLLGGFAMWGYKLDEKRHGEIRAALDERDVLAAAETLGGRETPGTVPVAAQAE
jgi:GPH family glycoside/pentoside/hexuronide:cation symporter